MSPPTPTWWISRPPGSTSTTSISTRWAARASARSASSAPPPPSPTPSTTRRACASAVCPSSSTTSSLRVPPTAGADRLSGTHAYLPSSHAVCGLALRSPWLTGANADSLPIGGERKCELGFGHDASHLFLEQHKLFVQDRDTLCRRAPAEIFERGPQPPSDLRRARPGLTDLVEREMDVRLPRHHRYLEPNDALIVSMEAIRKWPARELAQAVVEPVDRLHGGRRIEERRVRERPLGDVDEHAQAVRHVLLERSFEAQDDVVGDIPGEA